MQEIITSWFAKELDNMQLLKATFVSHSFPKHFHDTYVFGLVRSGEDYFYCDGKTYTAGQSQIEIINPYEVHTGRPNSFTPLDYISIYPSVELVEKFLAGMDMDDDKIPLLNSRVFSDKICTQLILKLHSFLGKNYNLLAVEETFTKLLFRLIKKSNSNAVRNNQTNVTESKINMVRDYINDNYNKEITLSDLAETSQLSSYYMLRQFKKAFGITPYAYLKNVRLVRAKTDLLNGRPILETAVGNGFYDQSHFHRHFKKQFGITPSAVSIKIRYC